MTDATRQPHPQANKAPRQSRTRSGFHGVKASLMHVSLYRLWFGDISTDGRNYILNCVKFSRLHNTHIGGTVVKWITMSPHSKNVPGLDPVSAGVSLCGESTLPVAGKVFFEHFIFLPQSSWVQLGLRDANVWGWMVVTGDTVDLYRVFTEILSNISFDWLLPQWSDDG